MSYPKAKVYFDGSHYIAIPKISQPWKKKNRKTKKQEINKEIEKVLLDNKNKTKKEKLEIAIDEINKKLNNKEKAQELVINNFERLKRNLIERKKRLYRKVYLQKWDYFCTFTYNSNKLTENDFKKKFLNTLKHLSNRKNWKYVGVWEKSPEKERLHFHGLFYIPNMVGELKETRDYSTKKHQMQTAIQNSFFLERFGRNDFKPIPNNPQILSYSINYLVKYIQKTGEKIVYSKHLATYFVSDILRDDIVCTIGQEDRKLLLFDDFYCVNDGEIIGQVSNEVIEQMPKAN